MTSMKLIMKEEGFESKAYPDPLTGAEPFTFGYGFTYLTEEEAEAVLRIRVANITDELFDRYKWFRYLTEVRKSVIVSMVYQLGFNGFRKFKRMIKYIQEANFEMASIEGRDSLWYKQTTNRAERAMRMFKEG